MDFSCVDCKLKPCKDGNTEGLPKVCPTREVDGETFRGLYDAEDLEIAKQSGITEGTCYGKCTRVEETMDFAYRMGYKTIGIAFCVGLEREAATFAKILRSNGFNVESASCKCGSISKDFIGVKKEDWVNPSREDEMMCNPAGQAYYLQEKKCDLCVVLGLCVGHDTLFLKHCEVPVTVLSGKDRVTGNNPIMPLYTADSQYGRVYTYVSDKF